ncbi:MAG: hypothetical protein R2751_14135 [Bacteroidales bacterium]
MKDGIFHFSLEVPLALGTVGGLTKNHPLARVALEILGHPSAPALMELVGAAGLASNFSAVSSLVTSGIQKGKCTWKTSCASWTPPKRNGANPDRIQHPENLPSGGGGIPGRDPGGGPVMTTFSAHGKLLLSAEYMVLHGALALALPLRQGQTLTIRPMDDGRDDPRILWEATHAERVWFRLELSWPDLTVLQSSDPAKSHLLVDALRARDLVYRRRQIQVPGLPCRVRQAAIGFDPAWGWKQLHPPSPAGCLGRSRSPLLHFRVSRGSGPMWPVRVHQGPSAAKRGDRATWKPAQLAALSGSFVFCLAGPEAVHRHPVAIGSGTSSGLPVIRQFSRHHPDPGRNPGPGHLPAEP